MSNAISVELQEKLISDLSEELISEPTFNASILKQKVISAIREVYDLRNYPDSYTDTQVQKDLYRHYSKIRKRALYDYNQEGIEGQSAHSENSVSRTYTDRIKYCGDILALPRF